jgi:hypothetical protein
MNISKEDYVVRIERLVALFPNVCHEYPLPRGAFDDETVNQIVDTLKQCGHNVKRFPVFIDVMPTGVTWDCVIGYDTHLFEPLQKKTIGLSISYLNGTVKSFSGFYGIYSGGGVQQLSAEQIKDYQTIPEIQARLLDAAYGSIWPEYISIELDVKHVVKTQERVTLQYKKKLS